MKVTANAAEGIISAAIEIAAPPEAVFEALTDPGRLEAWWGGSEYRTSDWKIDLRVGGQWSVRVRGSGGLEKTVKGQYQRIERPHLLQYTWLADWDDFRETSVRFEIEPVPAGTRLTLRHSGFAGRPQAEEAHAAGWTRVLDRLAAYLWPGTRGDYQRLIEAPVTAAEALEKISRVPEWWAADFTGRAQKLGDRFTVRFGETFVDFEIVEAVPDQRVVWQVTNSNLHWLQDKTEWTGTCIVWEISSSNGTTRVSMRHEGLVPGIECYENCEKGWDFYVTESLRRFLLSGKGLPDGRRGKGG